MKYNASLVPYPAKNNNQPQVIMKISGTDYNKMALEALRKATTNANCDQAQKLLLDTQAYYEQLLKGQAKLMEEQR
ncbi:hypothetical protein KJ764_01160 [Patescibacteria group bacterium]|nr:hypothetical protein [Patescibacteria group bacterium]